MVKRLKTRKSLLAMGGLAFALGVASTLLIVRAMPADNGSSGCASDRGCAAADAHHANDPSAIVHTPDTVQATGVPQPSPAPAATPPAPLEAPATTIGPPPPSAGQVAAAADPHSHDATPGEPVPGDATVAPSVSQMPASPAAESMTSGQATGSFDVACAGKLNPSGITQCGDSRNFCDTWAGGFCNDYRTKQTTMNDTFPQASDAVSLDCLSSTNAGQTSWLPYYVPTNNSDNTDVPGYELIPSPCGISMYEHFMTRMEDGQFGMVVMREQRPFDFAGRTGHIHFDVDLKTLERRYVRLTLSPNLTKIGVDDRNSLPQAAQAFDLWFRNGTFQGKLSQGGVLTDLFPGCNGCGARYYGQDNVRDHVDVYVSRTHVKVTVNGATQVDQDVQDLGFDRAYVYLQHVNYNSCKAYAVEHYATVAECQLAGNTFHWDDVAFDGPTLPVNGLTPVGSEDVVFNVWSAASCSVKGVAAVGSGRDYVWQTWVARLPAGTAVSPSDVVCTGGGNPGWRHYEGVPIGFEVVQQ